MSTRVDSFSSIRTIRRITISLLLLIILLCSCSEEITPKTNVPAQSNLIDNVVPADTLHTVTDSSNGLISDKTEISNPTATEIDQAFEIDSVRFHRRAEQPERDNYEKLDCRFRLYDPNMVINAFELPDSSSVEFQETSTRDFLISSNKILVNSTFGLLNYSREDSDPKYILSLVETDGLENYLLRYSESAELSFASRENVEASVLRLLSQLGQESPKLKVMYALDKKNLMEVQEEFKKYVEDRDLPIEVNWKENWSESDEKYLLIYNQMVNGLPVIESSYTDDAKMTSVDGGVIRVIWGSTGIETLHLPISFIVVGKSDSQQIISADEIEQIVADRLNNLIIDQSSEIVQVRLMYSPTSTTDVNRDKDTAVELIPVWVATLQKTILNPQDGTIVRTILSDLVFDAYTGKPIN